MSSGSKAKLLFYLLVVVLALLVPACASPSQPAPTPTPAPALVPQKTRAEAIPASVIKITPQSGYHPS